MRIFSLTFSALCFLLLISCNSKPELNDLQQLNGYWEIKEVTQKDGTKKAYKFNEMVDFISIDSTGNGFRKKVKPQIDGTYKVFNDREQLQAKIEDNQFNLYYTTEMDSWKETIIELEEDKFKVKNDRGIEYSYERFNGYLEDGTK
ncbi:hypothetical protein [Mesonia maritima]|uniref:Lipocalin-like domain-containing protein n=1 Tax=Mesonia maritima TaxID=1793873 RepID=A0ABU1K4Q1_9FLAO|nr:hypothetical protein [Mesonia maritima]MDR6300291.1 hypothetical protein [Mesonia maritima]